MKPLADRLTDIDAYYDGILLPADELDPRAVQAAFNKFKRAGGINIRNEKDTVNTMKKSTNSGSPYFVKRRLVVDKTIPVTRVTTNTQYLNGRRFGSCAILGWRGQEGGPTPSDTKQRVVWMFPFAVNIKELQMYQPMIERFQRFDLVPAWVSMESVDESITNMFDTKGKDDLVICTDFSKFDQHFNRTLQNATENILHQLVADTPENHNWLKEVFPIKYSIPIAFQYRKAQRGRAWHGVRFRRN